MGSSEVRYKRYMTDEDGKSCWDWPPNKVSKEEIKSLMGCCLKIAINFFFKNFVYTFGGEQYVQDFGGPIGARLTMCLARVVLQAWSEEFSSILKDCKIGEHLRAIYVDDGRNVVDKLKMGSRYNPQKEK